MPLLPNRRTLRSRWSTVAWAIGVCVFAAMTVPHGGEPLVDAAAAPTGNVAALSSLAAEED